jgi:hypothetical protein
MPDLLTDMLARIPGAQAALLLDPDSLLPTARAARDPGLDLALVAARAARLLRTAGPATGPARALVLEAERATLLVLTDAPGTVCLLLDPETSPARAAFEARRARRQAA